MKRCYTFSLDVTVFDPASLARSAALRATLDNLTPEQWAETRTSTEDDLIMLLDPGSLPGCDIAESRAERQIGIGDSDSDDEDGGGALRPVEMQFVFEDAGTTDEFGEDDEPATRSSGAPTNNVELVADLMTYSRHGALAQLFILDAITKQAEQIAALTPDAVRAAFDAQCPVHPHAWHAVAVDLRDRLNAFYHRHTQPGGQS